MMTNSLFVDTSGWMAFFFADETYHTLAEREMQDATSQTGITIYTTDHVIAEFVGLMIGHRVPRQRIFQVVEEILLPPGVLKLYTDASLFLDAWTFLRNRPDKDWSLADAISILQMQRLGITEALTNDHHFEQAGLIRLLR